MSENDRWWTIFIITLVWVLLIAAVWGDDKLPEADPGKPMYQKVWGGKVIVWPWGGIQQVRLPDAKTIEELKKELEMQNLRHQQEMIEEKRENKAKTHRFGAWVKRAGWLLLALGFASHFMVSIPMLKSAASSVMTLGLAAIVAGLGMQKTIEYESVIVLVLAVPAGGYALWKAREWSVSHWITKKLKGDKRSEASSTE